MGGHPEHLQAVARPACHTPRVADSRRDFPTALVIVAIAVTGLATAYSTWAVIDGQRIDIPESEQNLWRLSHRTVPPEGIEVTLEVESSQPLTLQVSDNSRDLPDIPGTTFQPRSDDMVPFPNFDYGTVVVRTLTVN